MKDIFSKPIEEISGLDLKDIIQVGLSENEQLEFKVTLPAASGRDAWLVGQEKVGKYARDCILEEVVAFANASGGVLLIGIETDSSHKVKAIGICPVPMCQELANRFRSIFADCVEPPLPQLEVLGIETEGNAGVLVIRTGPSLMAPHRVRTTRKCTIRRMDRCEELSMREIQDMTLNLTRALDQINERLDERGEKLNERLELTFDSEHTMGFRVTGLPVGARRYYEHVYKNRGLDPKFNLPSARIQRANYVNDSFNALLDGLEGTFRPTVRGAILEEWPNAASVRRQRYCEIYDDGLLEIGFCTKDARFAKLNFDPDWIIGYFVLVLSWACKCRDSLNLPTLEYCVQVELNVRNFQMEVGWNETIDNLGSHQEQIRQGSDRTLRTFVFPLYTLREKSDNQLLSNSFERDFLNLFGLMPKTENGEIMVKEV